MRSRVRPARSAMKSPSLENGDVRQRQMERNRALIQLVESWLDEDSKRDAKVVEAEWEEFKSALDADRLSDRKLFL